MSSQNQEVVQDQVNQNQSGEAGKELAGGSTRTLRAASETDDGVAGLLLERGAWVTNILLKDIKRNSDCGNLLLGDPKASGDLSTEQLKEWGHAGLYAPALTGELRWARRIVRAAT